MDVRRGKTDHVSYTFGYISSCLVEIVALTILGLSDERMGLRQIDCDGHEER